MGFKVAVIDCTSLYGNHKVDIVVTVRDSKPPIIYAPYYLSVWATSDAGAIVNFTAVGQDLVDGLVPVTCSTKSGSFFPVGTTNVICISQDSSGNRARHEFKVRVSPSIWWTLSTIAKENIGLAPLIIEVSVIIVVIYYLVSQNIGLKQRLHLQEKKYDKLEAYSTRKIKALEKDRESYKAHQRQLQKEKIQIEAKENERTRDWMKLQDTIKKGIQKRLKKVERKYNQDLKYQRNLVRDLSSKNNQLVAQNEILQRQIIELREEKERNAYEYEQNKKKIIRINHELESLHSTRESILQEIRDALYRYTQQRKELEKEAITYRHQAEAEKKLKLENEYKIVGLELLLKKKDELIKQLESSLQNSEKKLEEKDEMLTRLLAAHLEKEKELATKDKLLAQLLATEKENKKAKYASAPLRRSVDKQEFPENLLYSNVMSEKIEEDTVSEDNMSIDEDILEAHSQSSIMLSEVTSIAETESISVEELEMYNYADFNDVEEELFEVVEDDIYSDAFD